MKIFRMSKRLLAMLLTLALLTGALPVSASADTGRRRKRGGG